MSETWKVGELAERTGVSVRTLHYYEEIGLLSPARRTASGHRQYGPAEIERLLVIRSLVQLGFRLDEVHQCLEEPDFSAVRVLDLHIARLDQEMEHQRRLRKRLHHLAQRLRTAGSATTEDSADDFLQALEEMTMLEKHYTPEQLAALKQRGDARVAADPDFLKKAEARWRDLIARVRIQMEAGATPTDAAVTSMAQEWQGLIDEFTGSDPGIQQSLGDLYREDHAAVAERHGDAVPTPEMMRFMGQALQNLAS